MKISGRLFYRDGSGKKNTMSGNVIIEDSDIKEIRAEGNIFFKDIVAENVNFSGNIKGKTITSRDISIDGDVNISNIEAETVCIYFSQKSSIEKIVGINVKVAPEENKHPEVVSSFIHKIFGKDINFFESERDSIAIDYIKGANVELKDCNCRVVNCESAVVKGESIIEELLYSGVIDVESSVKIGRKKFIDKKEGGEK